MKTEVGPAGMSTILSYLAPSFVWTLLKDLWTLSRKGKRQLSHADKVRLRTKWRPLFEEEIHKNHRDGLRQDVIIRDVRRVDVYPEIPDSKGISPWLRLGLVSTYHRGILVAHTWETLTEVADTGEWRFTDYKRGEEGDIKVLLSSCIPFDAIEDVDWNGDEYYSYPHIYCYFDTKKSPYEKTAFYTKHQLEPEFPPFYTEVVTLEDVRNTSRKFGVASIMFHERQNPIAGFYRKLRRSTLLRTPESVL